MKIITNKTRSFFYLIVLLACYLTYIIIKPYIGAIIMSFLAAIIYRPVYLKLLKWCKGYISISILLTLIALVLSLLVPLLLIANITIRQSLEFTQDISGLVNNNNITLLHLISQMNIFLTSIPFIDFQITETTLIENIQTTIGPISGYLANNALNIGTSSVQFITQAIVFVSLLITILPIMPTLFQIIKDLSPLDDQLDQKYIFRITSMARAMVRGVFVIALAQGVAAGIFLAIGGVPYVAFWTLLCIIFALLPLGVNVITVPAGITLIVFGSIWQGILILIGGLVIISNIDTFLRPMLVPKEASLNPALVLIGALGGLNIFGFLGVIYGPVIMIFLVTTIEIYLEFYRHEKQINN